MSGLFRELSGVCGADALLFGSLWTPHVRRLSFSPNRTSFSARRSRKQGLVPLLPTHADEEQLLRLRARRRVV